MSYKPVEFPTFGLGLNLRDQPDVLELGAALDLLNVEFSERGAVVQRGGYAKFTSSELTNQPDSMAAFYKTDGTKRLIVGNGNRLDAVDSSGASTHNVAPTANPHFFCRFGGPGAERIFIANGTDTVRYYDGGFTTPGYTGTTPDGKFLAVTPWDNRMLNANRVGTAGGDNPSSVRFSAPGDPLTWDADDWNDLTPGDGEQIMGMVTFRDYVIVFKESKYFAIHGTGLGPTGDDTLVIRPYDYGVGLVAPRALAVTEEGVYFLDRKGVYRTEGGPPELVSSLIEPMLLGGVSTYFKSASLNTANISISAMTAWQNRIYLAVPTGGSSTNNRMLVFDPHAGWWSLYDIPASAMEVFRISSDEELMFAYPTGLNHIGRHRPPGSAYLADDTNTAGVGGNAIISRWRSGWANFGATQQKFAREVKLWGAGQCDITVFVDKRDAGQVETIIFGASTSEDLFESGGNAADKFEAGGNPLDLFSGGQSLTVPRLFRKSDRGTYFSLQFSNSVLRESFAIHQAAFHLLPELRPESVI